MLICVSKSPAGFSAIMTNRIPNFHVLDDTQCFPRYYFKTTETDKDDLLSQPNNGKEHNQERRIDNISPQVVKLFQQQYKDNNIDADALFYYVYGILHSPTYRARYANNLGKELPRIPYTASKQDFWCFSEGGKQLGDWHINYEKHNADPNIQIIEEPDLLGKNKDFHRVEKIKLGGAHRAPDKSKNYI